MKALVVYDSLYGNTEKVAKAIAGAISRESRAIGAGEAGHSGLKNFDCIIVGSPTHAGRPTPAMQKFLAGIPAGSLRNVGVAAFDTRVSKKEAGFFLRLVINFFGYANFFDYAAPYIADGLRGAGGRMIAPPEGFCVAGKRGPLGEGELERAKKWAATLAEKS